MAQLKYKCIATVAAISVGIATAGAQTRTDAEGTNLPSTDLPSTNRTALKMRDQDNSRTAEIGGTEIGQRKAKDELASSIDPIARINSRINNRVQNRLRNRIDRHYDPLANATSPFEIATDAGRIDQR